MGKQIVTILSCVAALALTPAVRADGEPVRPARYHGPLQAIGGGHSNTDGGDLYDNTMVTGLYLSPPNRAVPVEIGMAVEFSGTWHVDSFNFGYATTIPDDGTGPIEVVVNFYGGLALDDGPDTTTPVLTLDFPGLPGTTTSQASAYVVGPIDLVGLGLDFDWTASTSLDGTLNFNWVTFTFQQQRTGPVLASGEDLYGYFWTGTNLMTPFQRGSFFWFFSGGAPPAYYLQLSGYAK